MSDRKYNTENLTSLADLPEEKRKEIAAAGGRASQAAQRSMSSTTRAGDDSKRWNKDERSRSYNS